MTRAIVFDMDGTIADLYGVNDWLVQLRAESPAPYEQAKPLYDMDTMADILECLQVRGWKIIVTSWLAKNSSREYKNLVRQAKRQWLEKVGFPYDEIHLVQYGTTKADCTRKQGGYQILIDDNDKVRKGWHLGDTIDANGNVLKELADILLKEFDLL